jgi:hypothetical protein
MKLPFDDETIERAERFARETIMVKGVVTLGEILDDAATSYPGDSAFLRCLFLILEQAIDPRTSTVTKDASILDLRFDAGFVEGTDVRFANMSSGAPDAAK